MQDLKKIRGYLPDLGESWILIILLTIGGSIFAGVVNFLILLSFPSTRGWIELITYPLIFIPPAISIYKSVNRSTIATDLYQPLDKKSKGRKAYLIFPLLFISVISINLVTEPLTHWMGTPDFIKEFLNQISSNKISSFIAVAIFAPVLEEILCRGIILRGLLHHTVPYKAIFWSALMFGVMHLNPWQAIPAFILGLFMGWIYYKSGSLYAVIFFHFVNNGISYLVTVLYPNLPPDTGFIDLIPGISYYAAYAASLAIIYFLIKFINENYDSIIPIKIQPDS